MKIGVDMTSPPSQAAAQRMASLGFSVCGMYIGGPRAAAHTEWHQQDGVLYPVRDLQPFFEGFMPFTVGRNVPWDQEVDFLTRGIADANQANSDTGACGFDSGSPICMDLEYGTFQKYPRAVTIYCAAVVSVLNAAGHQAGLYSDKETVSALASWGDRHLFDFSIIASYSRRAMNLTDPSASFFRQFDPAEPPPSDGWQVGFGTVGGWSVDFDTYNDGIPLARYAL